MAAPKLRPVSFLWNDSLSEYVTSTAWSPDGKWVAFGSASGELAIFEGQSGKSYWYQKAAHSDGTNALSWHPNGKLLASSGQDGKACIWDITTQQKVAELEAGASWVEHLGWGRFSSETQDSADELVLAVAGDSWLSIFAQNGEKTGELKLPKNISDMKWIERGSVLAVATSAQVLLFSGLHSGKFSIKRVWEIKHPLLSMSFSPNGHWLMTGTQDNAVHVTNCETNQEFHMSGYPGKVRQTAWHKTNRWFATNGVKDAVLIWDCAGRGPEGRQPAILEGHHDEVSALQFQSQGDLLASGAKDGGVTFWNPNSFKPKVTGAKISSGVTQVAWAPGADLLAVGGEAGDVQVLGV